MENEKLEAMLIDYIDGSLSEDEKSGVEALLAKDNDVQKLYQELKLVMSAIDQSKEIEMRPGHEKIFENSLKAEMAARKESRSIFFQPVVYRAAAAVALVMVGITGGFWINRNNQHEQELAALRKEMEQTKQLMMSMLTNQQSASQRMQGVNVALTISNADSDIVGALANAMMTDPNTNVRLAALEALSKFIDDPQVRKLLTNSLSNQDDPVVQITLIQLLVQIKEKSVINDLEKIVDDEKVIQAVKDEAYTGILKLS
ncbi:MAG: HEAT repeat domain-containing protein [Cyclobacteriaceae bacterium]